MSETTLPAHEAGTGNTFANLALSDADEFQLKAAWVVQLV